MAGLGIFSDMAGVGPIPPAISWFCFPLRELNPQAGCTGVDHSSTRGPRDQSLGTGASSPSCHVTWSARGSRVGLVTGAPSVLCETHIKTIARVSFQGWQYSV